MKKLLIFTGLFLLILLFLSRCVICKMRWKDRRALRIFKAKNVPLGIHDTIIENRRLHYAIAGSSRLPSLVFIHGSPGSWFHYSTLMRDPDLLKKFRMIGIDRPGFGRSDYGKALHLQEQAKLLLPLLKSLKGEQPMFICGHSYGGALVAKLAADAPLLFKTVVIAAGSIDPSLEKKESWRHLMSREPFNWFLPGAFRPSNTELLYLKEDLKPLANDLGMITANIIFIHGDKDTWVPPANVAYGIRMMRKAATVRSDTLKGADHQVPWKRREEFKNILMQLE